MADIKFSGLTAGITLASSDIVPYEEGSTGITKYVTADKFPISGTPTSRLANPYKFSVYRNAALSAGASVDTKVSFDTVNFDTGTNYNNSTLFRFIAPLSGFYAFTALVTVTVASGDLYYATLYKNGIEWRRGNAAIAAGTAAHSYPVSVPCEQLTSSDYIEVFFHNGSAGGKSVSPTAALTYFNGCLISAT